MRILLKNFLNENIVNYGEQRDIPGVMGTSKLSPYLASGQIHVETIWEECEKLKIISNKIHPSLKELLSILETNEDNNEKYKCVQCLYSIFQSLYQDCLLPEGYIQIITKLKDKESSMKIKFKLMDILDRK